MSADNSQSEGSRKPPSWATGVVSLSEVVGDTPEETAFLLDLAATAKQYLSSFAWCGSISEIYFGDGIGKVIGIFLCRMAPSRTEIDEWLWVIVGDIPSAYLVTDVCKNPAGALDIYTEEISKWIALAREGKSSKDVIPVDVPATPEWAEKLRTRLEVLGRIFRPFLDPPARRTN